MTCFQHSASKTPVSLPIHKCRRGWNCKYFNFISGYLKDLFIRKNKFHLTLYGSHIVYNPPTKRKGVWNQHLAKFNSTFHFIMSSTQQHNNLKLYIIYSAPKGWAITTLMSERVIYLKIFNSHRHVSRCTVLPVLWKVFAWLLGAYLTLLRILPEAVLEMLISNFSFQLLNSTTTSIFTSLTLRQKAEPPPPW